jgi:hypothetical protein
LPRGGSFLQLGHARMSDDLLRGRAEDTVAAGVIAVMMRVDHVIDLPSWRPGLELVEAQLGRGGKLRVDHDQGILRYERADRAALTRHQRNVPANVAEGDLRWRRRLRRSPSRGRRLPEERGTGRDGRSGRQRRQTKQVASRRGQNRLGHRRRDP